MTADTLIYGFGFATKHFPPKSPEYVAFKQDTHANDSTELLGLMYMFSSALPLSISSFFMSWSIISIPPKLTIEIALGFLFHYTQALKPKEWFSRRSIHTCL